MATYKQKALDINEQVAFLISKGLLVSDEPQAKQWLSHISFYRLKHYTYTFRDINNGHNFNAATTFEQIIDLYFFDRELRMVIFDAIETIEVAFKTLLSNNMSCKYGSHWYEDRSYFYDSFDHKIYIDKITDEFTQQEEQSVIAYSQTYDTPKLPPSWMVFEFTTFGTISKMFESIKDNEIKSSICTHFSLPHNILSNWLHSLTHIRNRCAHHSRLIYRSIKTIQFPSREKYKFLKEADILDTNHIYCLLCSMQFLIKKINPDSSFKTSLLKLIDKNKGIDYSKIGITPNWKDETLWK